jgi:hypothetical protein
MQNFIVLGIIPGTNIQTTFSFWLWVAGTLLFAASLPQLTRTAVALYRIALRVRLAWMIERWEIIA